MAWNRSRTETGKRRSNNGGKSSVLNPRFVIAVVFLLAVAGGIARWAFRARETTKHPADDRRERPSMIVEAKPHIATNAVVEAVEPEDSAPIAKDEAPKSHIGRQVTNMYGKVYTVKHVTRAGTRYVNGKPVEYKPLFKHDSLNELDALYRVTPGFRIYSQFNPEAFNLDFLSAMSSEELRDNVEDTEEEAERRRLVREGVETLKAAIKEGGSPGELLREARAELSKLADFRDDCVAAVTEMKQSGASGEEIEEYYSALNKELEARSIPALLSPATAQTRLRAIKALKESRK